MTKKSGWKGEKQRHSLAKKGIRTRGGEHYRDRYDRRKKILKSVVKDGRNDPDSLFYRSKSDDKYVEVPDVTKNGDWFFDRGAIPGEPYGYYGIENGDIDTAQAVVIMTERNDFVVYEKDRTGKMVIAGVFGHLDDAMDKKNWRVI